MYNNKKSILVGLLASITMFLIYYIIMDLFNPIDYVLRELKKMWFWFLPLTFGFGLQIGLHTHIKLFKATKIKNVIASGGISSLSMIACCVHHITDFIPLLGISAISIFLIKYQITFIMLGIFFNILGVFSILIIIKQHKFYNEHSLLAIVSKLPLVSFKKLLKWISLLLFIIYIFY